MKTFFQIIYLTLLFLVIQADGNPDIINGVVQLDSENFEHYIQTHEHVFVKFYSQWCGHCKAMKADFEQAAQVLASEGVYLAEVDAQIEVEIQQKYQIRGFPTLKFFISGQSTEYNHGRTKTEIIEWVRKKLGPAALDLVSTDDVEQAVNDNEVVVVYFGEQSGSEYHVYEQVGKRFDDIIFGIAKEGEKFGIDKNEMPAIKMFKKFDEREVLFDRSLNSEEQLFNWIDYHWNEKLYNFTYRTAEKIFGQEKPVLFCFLDFNNKEHEEFKKIVMEVSEQLRGEIIVSWSQIQEGMGERLAEFMEINEWVLPSVRIMQMTDTETRRYVYNGELNSEGIIQFYQQWKNQELKAVYKSEPLPEDNDDKVIKKVVSNNFDDIVRDQTKNAVLMISAPWCKPCFEALAELEALAKSEEVEDLIVGVMDATENEVEGLIIEGFPCIKYYPKENKHMNINFEGSRTKSGFLQFIKEYYQTMEQIQNAKSGKESKEQEVVKEEQVKREDKDEL